MSVLFDTINIIGTVLYLLYDLVIFCGIFLIFAFEETHDKLLLHKSIIKTCNTFCKNICFDISWKMCELVTVTHMCYKKTILPQFHSITDNYFRNRHAVLLITNGEEVAQFKTWSLFEEEKENMDFDLILYTKYNEIEPKKNYTLIRDKCFSNPDSLLNNKCDVSFIVFQLTTDGNKYDIHLKEPHNFFVKDNVLKYTFFKWYMKKVYDVVLSDEFTVNYMTNDMSLANLHNPFFIKFNEDGVTSFSSGKPKVVSIEKDNVLDESDTSSNGDVDTDTDTDTDNNVVPQPSADTDTDTDTDNNVVPQPSADTDTESIEDPQPSADTDTDILISERLKYSLE